MKPKYYILITATPRNGILFLRDLVPCVMIAIKTVERRISHHNRSSLPDKFIDLIIVYGVSQRTRSANQYFSHTVEIDILKQERRTLSHFIIEKQYFLRTSDLRIENIFPTLIVPSGN